MTYQQLQKLARAVARRVAVEPYQADLWSYVQEEAMELTLSTPRASEAKHFTAIFARTLAAVWLEEVTALSNRLERCLIAPRHTNPDDKG